MKRLILASATLFVASLTTVGSVWAESTTTICVPEASSKPVLSTNTKGECPTKGTKVSVKYKSVQLPGTGELETLQKILPHASYAESGVAGKPTIQFSGVNVQIVNGEGKTESTNGEGNLVIGYDEHLFVEGHEIPYTQTGSHNLLFGTGDSFLSYGALVGGLGNEAVARYSSAVGGSANVASGPASTVIGGNGNTASGLEATVTAGSANQASGQLASVSGGESNIASGLVASVSGGTDNRVESTGWIGGGSGNQIVSSGNSGSIFGGKALKLANPGEACGGFPTEVC